MGSELLGYRIEALLGRSGMSVVYRAEDLRLKRNVALKLLAPALAEDERFRERFLRESELAASLDHPNIVPIYEAGEADGLLYIAMRYVAGGDLKALLRTAGRLPPVRTLALMTQVAEGLDFAHEAGLVHRDVKPGNILLDTREHCYLCDFGLTRQVASPARPTDIGHFAGTTRYAAPELIEHKQLTRSADLYSLGCVLYECLAGQPPFHSDSEFAVLWAHVNEPVPNISDARPELPKQLDGVLGKALAKQPEQRYRSGGELVEAARLAFPEPVSTAPASRPKRRALIGSGVLGVALVAISVVLALGGGQSRWTAEPTVAVTTTSVQRIDPGTNRLVATIALPVEDYLLAAGGGSLWAASATENRLFRIDPDRNVVAQTIPTVDPRSLAYGAGSLWVLNAKDGIMTRFDPTTGDARTAIALPAGTYGDWFVRASAEGVWVPWATPGTGNAIRIDPRSTAARVVTIGAKSVPFVTDFAPVKSILWAFASDPQDPSRPAVLRLDVRKPLAKPAVIPVDFLFASIVADEKGVWIADSSNDRLLHIDAVTRRIDRTVRVGDAPYVVARGEGSVWVSNSGSGTVTRVDAATGEVVATIAVGPNPGAVAVGSGSVWVDVHPR